jgi:hypothetical protein
MPTFFLFFCVATGLPANKGLWDLYGANVVEEVHAQPLLYVDFADGVRLSRSLCDASIVGSHQNKKTLFPRPIVSHRFSCR